MHIKATLLDLWLAALGASFAIPDSARNVAASLQVNREELDGDLYNYKVKCNELDGDLYNYKKDKREELDSDLYNYNCTSKVDKRDELDGDLYNY